MTAIEIDFDVYKELTYRRADESVSYNDVLRDLLKLPKAKPESRSEIESWTYKGVSLPNGTELRRDYKGQMHLAKIENGKWMQNGEAQSSPSAAAFAITESGINGWWFWNVKRPGDMGWRPLGELRS